PIDLLVPQDAKQPLARGIPAWVGTFHGRSLFRRMVGQESACVKERERRTSPDLSFREPDSPWL
ncbi:MAG: hypothetical protein PHU85_18150, partial [Phycisphaerae bacterium]|nr:hypothetical protein [Phycisphaerae bacterium]